MRHQANSSHRKSSPERNLPTHESRRNSRATSPSKNSAIINGMLSCFEMLFAKLDKSLEAQNNRLLSIEDALVTVLGGKFDRLISATSKISEALVGVSESNGILHRWSSQQIVASQPLDEPLNHYQTVRVETTHPPTIGHQTERSELHQKNPHEQDTPLHIISSAQRPPSRRIEASA